MSVIAHPNQQGFSVIGTLNFHNVMKLYKQGQKFISTHSSQQITIELDKVKCSDNSVLSLLVAWRREAGKLNKTLLYSNVPAEVNRLLTICRLHPVFSLVTGT